MIVNAVMIPRPTLSNVPVAEESVLGSTRNFEDGIASTNVPVNNSDNDEFVEGVFNERQIKKVLGTISICVARNQDRHVGLNVVTRACDVHPNKCWFVVLCRFQLQCSCGLSHSSVSVDVHSWSARIRI